MDQIERLIHRAVVIPVDDRVMWTQARLRAVCRGAGHPLHDKSHTGDLWIAASAMAHDLPLVSDDTVFVNVPGLKLVTEPA